MDRAQLFNALSNLPPQDFERLLVSMNMPRMNRAGASAKIGEQVSAFLEWADSNIGPELEAIARHLAELNHFEFDTYLQTIIATYEKWWEYYTLTDAVGEVEQPQPEQPSIFDFGLMVQTVAKEKDEANPLQEKQEKTERLPVLEGIRKYADGHVLLVGRPGSGKSTALIRLALEVATEALTKGQGQIPILVELRYWQTSVIERIQAFLHQHDPALSLDNAALTTLLRQGRFLLLIDGLNELPSDEARTQLTAFRRDHPKVPIIFTTRDLGLGGDLGIEKKLEMQPLTEPQMKEFIRAYVPDQAETMLRQLSDRLREFGQTPLLLWMLCEVFQQSPNRQMPTNLAEMFRAFTTMYEDSSVRKHEVALLKGDVRPLSDRRLWKEALMALAALMMQGETPVDFRITIHRTEAERELSKIFAKEAFPARNILDDLLKYHLLQNRTTNQLEFRHQLIQEYYAAEHLLNLLPELSDEQLKRDYLNLLKWTEAIALMLTLVSDNDQAFRVVELAIDNVDLMLGARLAGEVSSDLQKKTIEYLVKRIRQDEFSSINEIRILGKTRSEDAVPVLIERFTDKDNEELLFEIAFSLSQIGGSAVVESLSPLLSESSESIILASIFTLGKISSKNVLPIIRDLVQHPNMHIREQVVETLGTLGGDAVISELRHALKDSSNEVREKAVKALGELKDKSSFLLLLEMATADHPIYASALSLRLAAAEALGKVDPKKAKQELLKMSQSVELEYEVCQNAVEALGQIGGGDSAIEELLVAINKPSNAWEAAKALVELGDRRAVPGLASALGNSIPCEQAAYALGELGDPSAVPYLIKTLDHWYPSVQEEAVEALGKIGDKEAIPQLYEIYKGLENDLYNNLRSKAIIALGKLGDSRVREDLIKLLKRKWFDATLTRIDRFHVFEALKEVANSSTFLALTDLLRVSNSEDRWQAVEFLGDFGNETVIATLILMLNDENSTVQWKAVEALGKLDPQKVMPEIREFLGQSQEIRVQQAAIEVLGYFKNELAISLLLEALADANANVRCAAANSLTKLSGSDASSYTQRVLCNEFKKTLLNDDLTYLLERLQFNLNFYNYEIWQEAEAVKNSKSKIKKVDLGDVCGDKINNFPNATEVKIFERVEHYHEHPPDSNS
ncbi:MAG: hypothetical protein DCF17_09485 [Shackletoniella antarctica]|uniref:NACHT domain-containing protein n=1 Tax=Shackletoniella antarctica TaxID=268115 RepID=A0A2W4WJJ2_9CYAN|nr:MAG: hypothetical protein DCF17_09485 [Shackletoniella antarctica]